MKIINKKEPFQDWSLQVTCTGGSWDQNKKIPCGSLLELNADDLIKRPWVKLPDERGADFGFICPVCGCFTDINEEKLPIHLKNMAKEYQENHLKENSDE